MSLSDKWWWRALKAVYVLVWVVSLSFLAIIGYFGRPQQTPSDYWINIDCYKKENNWRFNPSLPFTSQTDVKFTYSEEDYVKKVCEYGLNKGDYAQFQSVPNSNYYVRTYFDRYGSWTYFPVGFLVAFVLIEAVKTMLLYIMGINVWRGMLLYGLLFVASIFSNDKKPVIKWVYLVTYNIFL